jgi:hypothetical protein
MIVNINNCQASKIQTPTVDQYHLNSDVELPPLYMLPESKTIVKWPLPFPMTDSFLNCKCSKDFSN